MFEDSYQPDELLFSDSQFTLNSPKGANYKRPDPSIGYTGHYSQMEEDSHVLESPMKKLMIRGYTGHRPHLQNLCGKPKIPSEDKQVGNQQVVVARKEKKRSFQVGDDNLNYRTYAIHMDTKERYAAAVQQVIERGQSQERLLKIAQAKLSERVKSYAEQMIRTRKLFESVDINKDGVLDEHEFHMCLEQLNVQFDDVQSLALFAYFDHNDDG